MVDLGGIVYVVYAKRHKLILIALLRLTYSEDDSKRSIAERTRGIEVRYAFSCADQITNTRQHRIGLGSTGPSAVSSQS